MLTRYPHLDDVLDLQFYPVQNSDPASFTTAQIEQFNHQGFIDPIPLFENDALADLQAYVRHHEVDLRRMKEEANGFISLHHCVPALYDLVGSGRTVAHLQDLVGPNVICFISDLINKPPGQTQGGSFHQDATFNAVDARSVIVWLAIEDADAENGCMNFIPGSHKGGVVECDTHHYVVNPAQYGSAIPCEVPAGYGVFMSDLLMHSSPPNRSKDRYRPGFTASYISSDVQPYEQINRWAVQCSGTDSCGYWMPHTRPEGPRLF